MANNPLAILISAKLNPGLSLKSINDNIKGLAKHPSLQKLDLKVNIDKSFVSNLASLSKNLSTITSQLQLQSTANMNINNSFKNTTQSIQEQTKATNEAIQAEKKWQVEREKTNSKGTTTSVLGNNLNNDKKIQKVNADNTVQFEYTKNQLKDYKAIEALDRDHYNALKTEKARIEAMEKVHYLALQKNRELDWKNLQASNKQSEALDKAHYQALKINNDMIAKNQKQTQSLMNSAYAGKSATNSATGVADASRLEFLNRQYDKVLANLNAVKSSGKKLTDSELAGINNRIEAINKLSARQRTQEKEVASLASTQLRAETQVNNLLANRHFSTDETVKLRGLLTQLQQLDVTSKNYKVTAKQLTDQISKMGSEAQRVSSHAQGLGDKLKQTFSNMLMYAGVGSFFYGAINAFKEMTQTIIEVDSQMTQLKRVMDDDSDFDSMLTRSIDLANELGRSIKEVNENAIGFARMGFDENQTLELAKTATLFQNISDLTPDEAIDTLTAAMTVFNVEANKSIEVANKINEVDNNFAISSQNIALSITKAGSAAKTFGVSMERLIGDTTAITTATRESGSVVGNALKTIYSRLTTMEKSESILANVGIAMRDLNGATKDAPVILDELSKKWGSLSKEQQQNTAVGLAGRFQLSRFLALMQNYQISINATETALHSQGSAVTENEKYMQSLEARIQKMKTAWDTLSLSVGDALISDSIVVLTSVISGFGSVLTSTVDTFGALPVIFGVSYAGLMLLSTGFKLFAANLMSTLAGLFGITQAANGTKLGLMGLSASAKIAGISLKSMLISTGVGAVLVGLGFILEKIIGHFSKTSEVVDETGTSLDKLKDKTGNLKELQDLSNEYDSLANKTSKTTEEKIRLASVESDLASKHGVTMKTVEDQTDAVQANTAAIQERINKLKEEAAIEQQKALDEYKANKTKINTDIQKEQSARDAAQAEVEYLTTMQKNLEKSIANKEVIKNDKGQLGEFAPYQLGINPSDYDTSGLATISESIAQAIIDAKKLVDSSGLEFDKAVSKREQAFKAQFSAYADTIEAGGTEVKASTRVLADGFASIMATTDVDDLKVLEQYKNEVFTIFQNTKITSLNDAIAALEKFAGSAGLTKDQFQILQTSISALNFQGINDGVEGLGEESENSEKQVLSLTDAMKALQSGLNGSDDQMMEFAKSVSAAKDDIDLLNKAQNELTENGYLSSKTIQEVSEKYTDFIKVTGLSKDAIYTFIKATKEEKNVVIQNEMDKTKTLIDETKKRIEAITDEMNAKMALLSVNSSDDLNAEKLGIKALQESQKILTELQAKYGILSNTLNDFKTDTTKTGKENDKLNDSYSDTIEILTELQKQLKNVQKLQDEEENKRRRMRQSSKEYQESLKKTIELKKQELALLEKGSKDPAQLVSTKVQTTVKTSEGSNVPSSSVNSGSASIDNMLTNALGLASEGKFKYEQVSGKFKGTYEEFVQGATSDCSQFVQEMFKEFLNTTLPRSAAEQAKQGVAVQKADLQAGDLVFFNTTGKDNSHVGIYTGNGKFVQMGDSGLKESDMNSSYWADKYQGARRVDSSSSISGSSSGVTTSKNGNKTTKTTGATTSEIEKAAEQNEQDIITKQNEIYDSQVQYLEEIKYLADNAVEEQERLIAASQKRQEKLDPTSVEFKKENDVQINLKTGTQSIKNQEALDLQKAIKEYGIESDEYDKLIKQLQTERADIQSEKYQTLVDNLNIGIDASKKRIDDLDNLIQQSQNKMTQFAEGSLEYNKELNNQIELKKKQKKENDDLITSLENLMMSENLDAATKKEFKAVLDELNLKDYTADIKDLNAELIASKGTPLTKEIDDLSQKIDLSKATIKGFKEGTKEYNDELKKQISLNNELIAATKKLKDYAEKQSQNEELSASVREEYKKQVQELTLSLLDYADAVKEIRETYADNVIEKYKKMLQEQQKLRDAAYDKEKEAEDARHETRMDNLDEEMSKFEETINAQSKSLDREVAEEDYTDQLAKLQKEKSELDSKFSSLSLDDSLEAKSKRADLQKEIDAKAEEITKLQRDREITIRKEGLSDQLEDRKNAIDKEKKLEDDKNKATLKGIEANKKLNDDYYDGLLNDEQYFYNMKQNLMSEDTVKVQNELSIVQAAYDTFFKELEKNSGVYASKIASNLKYSLGLDKDYANNFPTSDNTDNSNGTVSPVVEAPNNATPVDSMNKRNVAWDEYLSNKQKAEQMQIEMKNLLKDSSDYKNKQTEIERLRAINEEYRKQYGFQDGSYAELSKLTKFHTGGIVGEKGTTTKSLLQNEEIPAVLKKGEGIIDKPRDFFKEIAGNVMNNLSSMLSNFNVSQIFKSPLQPHAVENNLSINVENINGDKQGAKIVTDAIEDLWKRKTKSGW
ncbi:phage tail tape measure protein [Paenibacillus sp. FSL E2-0178]|uniref:phage tail tape measure protein n=1 Tax=Paenibacillus sp. FSL E2-0178 TaxID=2921361 RepID=UPI0031597D7E